MARIAEGEYYFTKNFRMLGAIVKQATKTLAEADTQTEIIEAVAEQINHLPKHIQRRIHLKLNDNAYSADTLLKYIYNLILSCDGMAVNKIRRA
jgi:hypothetical protein